MSTEKKHGGGSVGTWGAGTALEEMMTRNVELFARLRSPATEILERAVRNPAAEAFERAVRNPAAEAFERIMRNPATAAFERSVRDPATEIIDAVLQSMRKLPLPDSGRDISDLNIPRSDTSATLDEPESIGSGGSPGVCVEPVSAVETQADHGADTRPASATTMHPADGPATSFPVRAEFVLRLLLRKQDRDAILGDLVEEWPANVRRFGARKALALCWSDVAKSLWPLFKGRMWDLVVKVFRRLA